MSTIRIRWGDDFRDAYETKAIGLIYVPATILPNSHKGARFWLVHWPSGRPIMNLLISKRRIVEITDKLSHINWMNIPEELMRSQEHIEAIRKAFAETEPD